MVKILITMFIGWDMDMTERKDLNIKKSLTRLCEDLDIKEKQISPT